VAGNSTLGAQLEPQARSVLSLYDLPVPVSVELVTFSENAVYRVDFEDRNAVAIRLHSLGYHDKAAIESEVLWIAALRTNTSVITADVVRARTGDTVVTAEHPGLPPRNAVVFEWLSGHEPSGSSLAEDFRLLGRTNALLHQHAVTWLRPQTFKRLVWNLDGTIGATPHWGSWRKGPHLDEDMTHVLEQAAATIKSRLSAYGQRSDRFGLIHADLRLSNLLADCDKVQVIDFDDCGLGWFMYDLASAVTFMEDDPQVPQLIDAWLDGYGENRSLSEEDVAEIPTFLMLRRLVILAWLGSRPGTELVEELGEGYTHGAVRAAERYLREPAPVRGSEDDQSQVLIRHSERCAQLTERRT
jgi:Ser/Thr protein kinase RdoA (MazF antagonist)